MRIIDRRTTSLVTVGMLLLAALIVLSSCGSTRNRAFTSFLLPAAPKAPAAPPSVPVVALAEPPHVEPTLFVGETPFVFREKAAATAADDVLESLIRLAEAHFQNGKIYFQAGNYEAARREFDRAVETLFNAQDEAGNPRRLESKLEELTEAIYRFDLSGLSQDPAEEPAFDKPPLEDIPELTFPVPPTEKDLLLNKLRATVSQLPLEVNDEVLRYIHYFSSGRGRKILEAGLGRAGRYRPLIQRILDEEGVPQELIHLAQAESGFYPRAVSRKRATGMWQFMAFRGQQYGLTRTKTADDRLDPEKATRAAARHLRDLYHQFGDWYLAIAAYNCGPGVVQKAVERTGYADLWELRRRNVLPRETSSYVPIILAMAIMAKNAAEYGLDGLGADPPLEYDTVELTAPTSLLLVADITERPVGDLRDLNPALLKGVAPPGYMLRVPQGTAASVASALELVPREQRAAWRLHRVERGETLNSIARSYRVSPGGISRANGIDAADVESGNLLLIPAKSVPEAGVTKKKAKSMARRGQVKKSRVRPSQAKSASPRRSGMLASRSSQPRKAIAR